MNIKNRFLTDYGFSQPLSSLYKERRDKMAKELRKFVNVETRLVKFDKVGMSVEGEYIGKKQAGNFGNDFYDIKDNDGVMSVPGSVVLARKMGMVPVGSYVRITFTAELPNPKAGQNPIKDFKVEVAA